MNKIRDIGDLDPRTVREVVCLNCLKRWTADHPQATPLVLLQCPKCGRQGLVIATGD